MMKIQLLISTLTMAVSFLFASNAKAQFPGTTKSKIDTSVDYSVVMASPSGTTDYKGPFTIEFGEQLDVQIRGLGNWIKYSSETKAQTGTGLDNLNSQYIDYWKAVGIAAPLPPERDQWKDSVGQQAWRLCLYIDSQPFPELTPIKVFWMSSDDVNLKALPADTDLSKYLDATGCPRRIVLRFSLERPDPSSATPETISRWDALTTRLYEKSDYPHDISVGFVPTSQQGFLYSLPSAVSPDRIKVKEDAQETLSLRAFSLTFRNVALLCLLVFVSVFFWMAKATDMLRDSSLPPNPGGRYPFSLGMCQLALWTVLIVASYFIIYFCTNDYNRFSTTALTLLGISSATGLSAAMVNTAVKDRSRSSLSSTELAISDRVALDKLLTGAKHDLAVKLGVTPVDEVTVEALQERMFDLQARANYVKYWHFQFALDLLRERNSVNLHRFQLIVWTVVLAGIFLDSVYRRLAMPTFDPSILILVGISSGTYVGFKFPESLKNS